MISLGMDSHDVLRAAVLHGGWLAWPVAALLLIGLWRCRQRKTRVALAGLCAATLLFLWARFAEPNLIVVRHTVLHGTGGTARIVLIADPHLGMFKGADFLRRVVARINPLQADAVLIAGDLTYEPQGQSLDTLFAPLAALKPPTYAVLGNHDEQKPGPEIDLALRAALRAQGVAVIEGRTTQVHGFELAGLGDRWAGKDDAGFLARIPSNQPLLVLAHNPDSADRLRPREYLLLLAGHTHGGQLRIPWLYRQVLPVHHGFDRGEQWYAGPRGRIRVYTTSGLGESGLPVRLFDPPVIDLLELRP